MIKYNQDFLIIRSSIEKLLITEDVEWYPTNSDGYKEHFKRDSMGCIAFYDKKKANKYYLYFNTIYFKDEITYGKLSSITIVDNSELSTGVYKPLSKIHIDCVDDGKEVLKIIKYLL